MYGYFTFTLALAVGATFGGTDANEVDEICGTETGTVKGVKRQAKKHELHGVEMNPLPKFTFDANCKDRVITKCSYESGVGDPKKKSGNSETFELTIPGRYQCYLQCTERMGAYLWCSGWPKGLCAGKAAGTVNGVKIKMREEDIKTKTKIAPEPFVFYDADCAAGKITKCKLGTHEAFPEKDGGKISFLEHIGREDLDLTLECNAKVYATLSNT